ncbi:hypothetical protein [Amycolatopsis anabasis]|uniref:hypothetical protein n=1 Tax=Amycolatopsis anabasis TaxID=1840409 RepID=UPI00131D47A1|nr:hypothetical protein [Amycolatopsis anabasis]
MGKTARRVSTLGFAVAASAALVLPGTASAAPGPDPLLHGDCHATLKDKDGRPVTVDVGALVDKPGLLDLGLGSESTGAGKDGKPLLSLPVSDLVHGLGLSNVPVVNEAATVVCDTAKTAGNGVAGALESALPGDDNEPAPPDHKPGPGKPIPPTPGKPTPPNPGKPGGDQVSPVVSNPFNPDVFAPVSAFPRVGTAISATLPLTAPGIIPPVAPGLSPETPPPPNVVAQNSGTAEALPAANPPARLPLLLAVLALALVAAALVRSWMRRKAA